MRLRERWATVALSPTATAEIVLDAGDLTFADSTLVNFVAVMHQQLPITGAPPNRWVVELLRLVGRADKIRILDRAL